MAEDFLLPSVKTHFDVQTELMLQECPSGEYASDGWGATIGRREQIMLALLESSGEPFVWSDADVICNAFTPEDALKELGDSDIAAIDEGEGRFCAGFMVVRPGSATMDLFKLAIHTEKIVEQDVLNRIAADLKLKVRLMPKEQYTSVYHLFGGAWDGTPEAFDGTLANAKVFHANWIIGIEKKLTALRTARRIFAHENDQYSSK